MENTTLIGLSRQMVLQRELDVIANNVANLNTNGFKGNGATFEEYLMPIARAGNFQGPDQRLSYVQDRGTYLDLSQGPLQQTGNPLDVAIDGDAFLAVQTPRGERYTRNGALQLNAAGQLVTSAGEPVLGDNGPIVLQTTDKNVSINPEGTISVRNGSSRTLEDRGKLRMVTFAQRQQLQKEGSSNFAAPAGVAPVAAGPRNRLIQGAIEKSNVSGVAEMSHMVDVSRTYAMVSGLMQSQHDMRKSAIQQLADVPSA
jgi:flagellar basal-body rod protein FlgF